MPISAQLRLLLTQLSFFGDADQLSFQDRLAVAYKDFRVWRRENKVSCSHPPFTPNGVAWFQKSLFTRLLFSERIVSFAGHWKKQSVPTYPARLTTAEFSFLGFLPAIRLLFLAPVCPIDLWDNGFRTQTKSGRNMSWLLQLLKLWYLQLLLHNLFVETTPCIILSNLDLLRNLLSTNMLLAESSPRYLCPGIGAAVSI